MIFERWSSTKLCSEYSYVCTKYVVSSGLIFVSFTRRRLLSPSFFLSGPSPASVPLTHPQSPTPCDHVWVRSSSVNVLQSIDQTVLFWQVARQARHPPRNPNPTYHTPTYALVLENAEKPEKSGMGDPTYTRDSNPNPNLNPNPNPSYAKLLSLPSPPPPPRRRPHSTK